VSGSDSGSLGRRVIRIWLSGTGGLGSSSKQDSQTNL